MPWIDHKEDTEALGGIQRHPSQKTCLYNFDPLKPHFYIVKLGFPGELFLGLLENIDCFGTRQNRLGEAVLTSTHNLCFEQKYEKYLSFLSENFQILKMKFSIYLKRAHAMAKSKTSNACKVYIRHCLLGCLCLIVLKFCTTK